MCMCEYKNALFFFLFSLSLLVFVLKLLLLPGWKHSCSFLFYLCSNIVTVFKRVVVCVHIFAPPLIKKYIEILLSSREYQHHTTTEKSCNLDLTELYESLYNYNYLG